MGNIIRAFAMGIFLKDPPRIQILNDIWNNSYRVIEYMHMTIIIYVKYHNFSAPYP